MTVSFLPYDVQSRSNVLVNHTNSTTNQMSSTIKPQTKDTAFYPTTTSDYLNYNGTSNTMRYVNAQGGTSNYWHVTAPYSVEVEFMPTVIADRWIATVGEGFSAGWPEWSLLTTSTSTVMFNSSSTNNGNTTSITMIPEYHVNQWYKIGFMWYTSGSNTRVRGYVNGNQVFDVQASLPYTTSNGLAIGSDWVGPDNSNGVSRLFKGRIRNFYLGRSLFWTV